MMRLWMIAFLSFFIKANAQIQLTFGDVYDYAMGDVFQYDQTPYSGPPTYITDTVTSKNLSGNSVTYQVNRYSYQLQSCQSCSPTITRSTYSVSYSNLSSNFTHTNTSSCCTAGVGCYHDTLRASGYCNLPTYESVWTGPETPGNLSTCMKYDASFTKGLGMTYEHNRSSNTPYDQTTRMIYYQKGTITCGSYVGIKEHEPSIAVSLFPNPAITGFTIDDKESIYSNADISIINYLGETVASFPYSKHVDISALTAGFYTLNIKTKSGSIYSARFIKVD